MDNALAQPPRTPPAGRGIVRLIYTNNPFYVISALLVFFGLRSSFDASGQTFDSIGLMIALAGFTLLLAVTAWLVVRLGGVWEDARSLLLLVAMMLLAISITFDDALVNDFRTGAACLTAGLGMSLLISEALLWGLRMRLPFSYRAAYYLLLALFYLYPIFLARLAAGPPRHPALSWALASFPLAAGLAMLVLLPAVRGGPKAVRDNGTPWKWPWYPWVLFLALGVGVCGRSYYVCIAFDFFAHFSATIFSPWFLSPFLLACCLLWLQRAAATRRIAMAAGAMAAPWALLALAAPWPQSSLQQEFTDQLIDAAGAPLVLTLTALAGYYAYAFLRRVRFAADGLTLSLLLLVFVELPEPGAWRMTPLLLAACLQTALLMAKSSSYHGLLASGCITAGLTIHLTGTPFTAGWGFWPVHVMLSAMFLLQWSLHDRFSAGLRIATAALTALLAAAAVALPRWFFPWPDVFQTLLPPAYLMLLALTVWGLWWRDRAAWWLALASGHLCAAAFTLSWHGYWRLKQRLAGLDQILAGAAFFVLAAFISALKGGLLQRLRRKR